MKTLLQSLVIGLIAGGGYFAALKYAIPSGPEVVYESFVRARRVNDYEAARPLAVGPAAGALMQHQMLYKQFISNLDSGDAGAQVEMYGTVHDVFVEVRSRNPSKEGGVLIQGKETVRRLKGSNPISGVDPTTEYLQTVELREYSTGWKVYSFMEERVGENDSRYRYSSAEARWGALP